MIEWQENAACKGEPLEFFFELYEDDRDIAEEVDNICFGCPVREECLSWAVKQSSTGVFGGAYLIHGRFNKAKNKHKLPYISNKIESEINYIKGRNG